MFLGFWQNCYIKVVKIFFTYTDKQRGIFVSNKNCSSVHFWSLSVNYSDVCENWFVNVKESVPKWNFFLEVKKSYQYCRTLNNECSHFPHTLFVGLSNLYSTSGSVFVKKMRVSQKIRMGLFFKAWTIKYIGLWAADSRKSLRNFIVPVLWKIFTKFFPKISNSFC